MSGAPCCWVVLTYGFGSGHALGQQPTLTLLSRRERRAQRRALGLEDDPLHPAETDPLLGQCALGQGKCGQESCDVRGAPGAAWRMCCCCGGKAWSCGTAAAAVVFKQSHPNTFHPPSALCIASCKERLHVRCSAGCSLLYHMPCWRKALVRDGGARVLGKDYKWGGKKVGRGPSCFTLTAHSIATGMCPTAPLL